MIDPRIIDVLAEGWGISDLRGSDVLKPERVWRVTLGDGRIYVIKNWGALDAGLEERVAFHQDVIRHVASQGIAGESALPSTSGNVMYRHQGDAWWVTLPLANNPTSLLPKEWDILQRGYGRSIAELHRALATYPEADARRRTWRKDLLAEVESDLPSLRNALSGQAQVAFTTHIDPIVGALEDLRNLPEQLIFFDMHHGNVLRDGARVSGFVDANHLSFGLRIWDLFYLMSQSLGQLSGGSDVHEWVRLNHVLMEGYVEVNPLGDAECRAIWSGLLALKLAQLGDAVRRGRSEQVGSVMGQLDRLIEARPLMDRGHRS